MRSRQRVSRCCGRWTRSCAPRCRSVAAPRPQASARARRQPSAWSQTRARPRGIGRAGAGRRARGSSAAAAIPIAGRRPRTSSGRRRFRAAAIRRRSSGAIAFCSRRRTRAGGGCRSSRFGVPTARGSGRRSRPRAGRDGGAHHKNGHASATPATDGERVYVSFGTRGLMALDLNGKIVWQQDLGQMDAYHGTAGSPLLYKDRIILYQDQYSGSFIAAFDTRTGQQLWRTSRDAIGRMGHADRRPRRRSRRDHRERPEARARVRPRHRARAVALRRHHVRSDSDARRRLRDGVLLVGPRRPDAGDSSGRPRRRHAHSPRVVEPARVAVRAVADSVRRVPLHGERHGEHRHLPRREDRAPGVAGAARRRAARRDFRRRRSRSTARSSSPTTTARRSCCAPARRSSCCTSIGSANGCSRPRRSSTAAGTSEPARA